MCDVQPGPGTLCPICERGGLIAVGPGVWQCARQACNSEFYYDGKPGERMLAVRDKPSSHRRRRGAAVLSALLRVAAIALAVYLMRDEGLHQRTPGVWFAMAVILIVLALLVPSRRRAS
jgi:hypothetical protein